MPETFLPKGVHTVKRKLKDGGERVHYYAWRGGPPIVAPFGTAAFMAELETALKPPPNVETLAGLVARFKADPDFTGLAEKTRRDYTRHLTAIEAAFGKTPLKLLADKRARGKFKDWRAGMADRPRTADYAWSVLARLMSFGVDRGDLERNPCERGGRIYKADRAEKIWEEAHLLQLFAAASPEVAAVVIYALWTGQRQGDVLAAKWSDLEIGRVRVKQGKTSRRVMIPLGAPLAELVAGLPRVADTILTNSRGLPWTEDGYRASFGTAFQRAGIVEDLHFHDLRGTAVTRMALAGCTVPQIAAVSGHSMKSVQQILDAHYMGGQFELAEQAIRQLEAQPMPAAHVAGERR